MEEKTKSSVINVCLLVIVLCIFGPMVSVLFRPVVAHRGGMEFINTFVLRVLLVLVVVFGVPIGVVGIATYKYFDRPTRRTVIMVGAIIVAVVVLLAAAR